MASDSVSVMPVLAVASPASASTPVIASRGDDGDNGDPEGPNGKKEKVDNCPTDMWTVPLEVKGLACVLLLPKPEKQGQDGGENSGGGGLGDLLG